MSIDLVRALWRHAIPAVFVFIGTLIVTVIATALQTPVYESAAQLIVAPAPATSDTSDVIRSVETLERRTVVATFARMPSADDARNAIAAGLHIPATRAIEFQTHGSVVPNTNIIRIDTRGPDPKLAAAIANASAERLAVEAQALYRVYALRMLSRATPAAKPAYPDRKRNLLVGFVIGAALALATALTLERLR